MLGNAGKKLSRMVDLAEELYERVVELREQVRALRETTQETRDRVVAVEDELADQRALLEAIADAQGLAVGSIESPDPADDGGSSASTETDGPAAADPGADEGP